MPSTNPIAPAPAVEQNQASSLAASHIATATRNLLYALHYHRYFGQPLAGCSDEHNLERAIANDRTVRQYAALAGQYAYFAATIVARWIQTHPEAMGVDRIRDAMYGGYYDTAMLMRSPSEVVS